MRLVELPDDMLLEVARYLLINSCLALSQVGSNIFTFTVLNNFEVLSRSSDSLTDFGSLVGS